MGSDGVPFGRMGKPWLDLVNLSFLRLPHMGNRTKLLAWNEPEEEVLADLHFQIRKLRFEGSYDS